ncbi:MAG: MASE3 domain-containing protein [Clostridiaceae bacterium]
MNKMTNIVRNYVKNNKIDESSAVESLVLVTFISVLLVVSTRNYNLFHILSEAYSALITIGIYIVAINTYKISKNKVIMVLGIGCIFIAILNLMCTFAYPELNLINNSSLNMVIQFWVAASYLDCATLIIACIYLYKPNKKLNPVPTFFTYIIITSISIYFIINKAVVIKSLDANRDSLGTYIGVAIIIIMYCTLLVAIFMKKSSIDAQVYLYVQIAIVLKIIDQGLFTFNIGVGGYTQILAHILKIVSFYCIYKGIIQAGIQRPSSMLFYKIEEAGNQLNKVNNLLMEESKKYETIKNNFMNNDTSYDLIINNSSDAIILYCEDKIIFANETSKKLLRAKRSDDLLGINILDIIPLSNKEKSKERIQRAYLYKSIMPFEENKFIRMDKSEICVESAGSYISYQGKDVILIIFRDISYKKEIVSLKKYIYKKEKILNKTIECNKLMTEFFSNISHELKTPLNVILGSIQVLNLKESQENKEEYIEDVNKYDKIMKQNCFRLLRLINNVIDLSKIDSGYLKPELSNENIVSIVEDITLSVSNYIEDRGINLVFDTNVEEKIMAIDVDKIERIILNLLSNAIKFTNKGDSIFVAFEDLGENVVISIRDTGVGIPEDKLKMIFDRFSQVDKTLSRNREGSGVGLSLVKSLVEMHDGKIGVESVTGEGSEFKIEIPVKLTKDKKREREECIKNNVERISVEFSDIYSL